MKNFENIHYPFFGLYKKPEKITFSLTKIFVHRTLHSHQETIDDKTLRWRLFCKTTTNRKTTRLLIVLVRI